MENNYLFIIPLTPKSHLNKVRQELQKLCLSTLKKQTYSNWKALLVGSNLPEEALGDERFIHVAFEGKKEEKLQKATQYILDKKNQSDYIIRLDDDDIFNPKILNEIKDLDSDLYVDKTQFFWNYETKQVASRTWYWFPNTCIHRTEHALAEYGDFAEGDFTKFRKNALLIENDHSKLHSFYIEKKVVFSNRRNPIYLRSITTSSITANNSNDHTSYINRFGNWKTNKLKDYLFLGKSKTKVTQSIFLKLRNIKSDLSFRFNYLKQIGIK